MSLMNLRHTNNMFSTYFLTCCSVPLLYRKEKTVLLISLAPFTPTIISFPYFRLLTDRKS